MDELARACATLGVPPGAPLDAVRKRYKSLVRQWHPDRFASDPQGQAEAAVRMRAINDAFRCVVARRMAEAPAAGEAARPSWSGGRRMTREEIDRMVESLGSDGPVDWMFGKAGLENHTVPPSVIALYVAVGVGMITSFVAEAAGLAALEERWVTILGAVLCYPFVLRLLRRIDRSPSDPGRQPEV